MMEEQMQALLGSMYASPQQAFHNAPKVLKKREQMSAADMDLFSSDDFRIFFYKVLPCSIRGPHEWTTCGFCHPGEKATRRCPQKFNYTAIACPDMKLGECSRGHSCCFAHNVFEYWLHPLRYRTQMCSYGVECRRATCFFAHQYQELRHNEQLAQLQAIERELEGGDPGNVFLGGSRWSNHFLSNPKFTTSSPTQQQQQQQQRQQRSSLGEDPRTPRHGGQQIQGGASKAPLPVGSQQALFHTALQNISAAAGVGGGGSPKAALGNSSSPTMPSPLASPSALASPLQSMSSCDIDSQMAAALKLIVDLTSTKQQLMQQQQRVVAPPSGWQAATAAPALHGQQRPPSFSPLGLSPQLLSHCSAPIPPGSHPLIGSLPSALPSADLHSALIGLLPELLKQLGGSAVATATPAPPPGTNYAASQRREREDDLSLPSSSMAAPHSPFPMPQQLSSSNSLSALPAASATASQASLGAGSLLTSDGCRSPVCRSDDGCGAEEPPTLVGPASFGLAGMGMGLGLGMELGMGLMGNAALGLGSMDIFGNDDMLLDSNRLLESLSQLVDEPTTTELMPGVQKLDAQLRRMSMASVLSSPMSSQECSPSQEKVSDVATAVAAAAAD